MGAVVNQGAAKLARDIRNRKISAVETVNQCLDRIAKLDERLNAFVTVSTQALQQAAEMDKTLADGKVKGPLHGVPIALKDMIFTSDMRTTASSKRLQNYVPDYDATVVKKLRKAGCIVMGKTQTHEFAYGSTTNNEYAGPSRNPWDPKRIPGGSSGGSAIAVATGMSAAALGTDTGGSVRTPAALCGISGLKPTYGRVSRHGVLPLAWSLDHVGPMAPTVEDLALLLNVLAGKDLLDGNSADVPVEDYLANLGQVPEGLKIGIPRQYYFENADPEVIQRVEEAVQTLTSKGAIVKEVSIPRVDYAMGMHLAIVTSEATALHERELANYPGEYSSDVRTAIDAGKFILASDYIQAMRARRLLFEDFMAVFEQVDVIVTPTVPIVAPLLSEDTVVINGKSEPVLDPLYRLLFPSNLCGLPSLSLPCGFVQNLPVGFQMIAGPFKESLLLQAGHWYQMESDWHLRFPNEAKS